MDVLLSGAEPTWTDGRKWRVCEECIGAVITRHQSLPAEVHIGRNKDVHPTVYFSLDIYFARYIFGAMITQLV